MLSFVVFWAYIGFSQYMLIWYANTPEETEWFIRRNTESVERHDPLFGYGPFLCAFRPSAFAQPEKEGAATLPDRGLDRLYGSPLQHAYCCFRCHSLPGCTLRIWDFLPLIGMGATLAFVFLRIVGRASLFSRIAIPGSSVFAHN